MADREEIREQLKGTHDIARAAELLLDEGNITYDNSEVGSAQGTVGTMPAGEGYQATRANCFEFVQMCNEISCCKPTYRWGNRLHYLIDPSNMREWDGTSEIPRGSVIVEVNPTRGEGQDRLFHTGISVGDSKVISNLDRWGNDIRREPVGEAFQTAPHTIYYGPYPGCPCSAEERRQSWLHLRTVEPLAVATNWLRTHWLGSVALAALGAGVVIFGLNLFGPDIQEIPVEPPPPFVVEASTPSLAAPTTTPAPTPSSAIRTEVDPFEELIISVGMETETLISGGAKFNLVARRDPSGDRLYSDPLQAALHFLYYVDIERTGAASIPREVAVDLLASDGFRCGSRPPDRRIVCTDSVLREPTPFVFIGAEVAGDIPLQGHEGNMIIYSAVFDADGDPANNYRAQPPFSDDFFQGTDRWYELVYTPQPGEWSLTVSDARTGRRVPAASKARAVLWKNIFAFFIPASELPAEKPGFRVTAFVTDGSFRAEKSGGDVAPGPPNDPWRLFELPELGP